MQVIQSKTKLLNHILYIALPIIALGILTGAFLLVAHENSIRSSFAVSDSEDYTVTLQDDTSISVGFVGDPLVLNLQPTAAGNFVSGNLAVEVATNSYYGYNLSMSATTTSLSGSVAVGSEKPTIPTLQSATSEADFPTNYWGFKRGADTNKPDANYQPMLAGASIPLNLVSETDNFDPNSDISTVTFGVKLDNRTPSGTYDITINFLAVANINTPYYMQNITDAELANLMPSVNDTYTLTDSRDNKQYTVAKLKDGQYWMTTNLDLAGGTTLTPNDSDVTANYTLPASSKIGFDDDTKAFVFNSNSTDCTGTNGCYSYYSWNAATAMSGTSITTANTDAPSSICPAGWHLPTSRYTDAFDMTTAYQSDFYVLAIDHGMNTGVYGGLYSSAGSPYPNLKSGTIPNFVTNGTIYDGSVHNNTFNHNSWSKTYTAAPAYFVFNEREVRTASNAEHTSLGMAVRCIHNATMQNLTDTEVAAMNTNETKVLYDSRDNQRYTATKILDGKLWMTKNLNLAGGTQLSSADTDMPAGYTLPTANGFGVNNTLPTSSKTGFSDHAQAYVFNSNSTDCTNADGCYSYYSWNAATLGSGASITTENADAPYSICPKGWRLPTSRSTLELAQGTPGSDFYHLAVAYGLPANVIQQSTPNFYNNAGPNTIPNFVINNQYDFGVFRNDHPYGRYTASTAKGNDTENRSLTFDSTYVITYNEPWRRTGLGVRCLYDSSMQNFTTTDAAALAEHDELTLTDRRDGKTYYVTKLKDGNVWMTQNLDLDLSASTTLTHADTDLGWTNLDTNATWTPVRSTINASGNTMNTYPTNTDSWATDGTNSWNNDNYTPYSVDAGYKYILPIKKTTADGSAWNSTPYDTVYNSLAECQAAASDSSKNSFGLACDGHTSVGNYYNFAAANATNNVTNTLGGSDEVVQNADLPDSICPAGWRLPKDNSDNSKNEFAILLGNNNFNSGYDVYSSFNPNGLNAIRQAPLYFVRSGSVDDGTLQYAGVNSFAWSSTISGASSGYLLDFYSSDVDPAHSNLRLNGFSVRCLLRTE